MMQTQTYLTKGWKQEMCGACNGYGLVSDYGLGGDFYGPKECEHCCSGYYWVTPKGRHVEYPGGRFV
jgi:hypothetical protein